MYRNKALRGFKHGLYICLLLVFYMIQTNPFLFSFFGIKPLLIIPAVVIIAMQEGEYIGAFYGAAAGALCDLSVNKIFGLNAILILFCCTAVGLAVVHLVRFTMLNSLLLTAATMLIKDIFCFYFYYAMWGYSGIWRVFVGNMLPELILTLLFTPAVYLLFTRLKKRFDARLGD